MEIHPYLRDGLVLPRPVDGHLCPQCGGIPPGDMTDSGLVIMSRCGLCHGVGEVSEATLAGYLRDLAGDTADPIR